MTSVPLGIDFGNHTAVLGVARNRGIDIVVNEVSNRATPSLVGFGWKNRFLGEAAKGQETSNVKNTVGSLKRLIGRTAEDPEVDVEKDFNGSAIGAVKNETGVKVQYAGKSHEFTFTQLAGMYFSKLRQTVIDDTKGNVNDVVIAVPAYFTDSQRRAVANAAVIANLNPVRIVNDTSAAAVGYGVFRTDLPEDKPRYVAIVDVGHSDYTVSVLAFKKGEAKVLATVCDKSFGGRVLDLAIAKHFQKVFLEKYKIDVRTNPKAWARVLLQAERLKKILSANTQAQFNVESLMNDIDVSATMERSELEQYLEPYLSRISDPVKKALATAKLSVEDLDSVELIGGCTRVPCVKEKISEAFAGKQLSYTLNQDEAIARGAAFLCAAHSPTVRVRPFKFEDYNQRSVTFSWEKTPDEDIDHLEVFPAGSSYPATKVVTLFRTGDFALEANYTVPEELDPGFSAFIGKWNVSGVKPADNGDAVAVKIKLRQDASGFYIVESAYTAEEVTVEEPVEPKEGEEVDEDKEPETRTVKKWVKKDDLTITHTSSGISEKELNELVEFEGQMSADDKLVFETEDRKNALEEYIYEIRDKMDGPYKDFASADEKERLLDLATQAEEWLYGDGEDSTKGKYVAKLEELQSIGNLIKGRYISKQEEERQAKMAAREAEEQRKMAERLQAAREAEAAKAAEDKPSTEDVDMVDEVDE